MVLETVDSSSVYAIGYDAARQRIIVVFKAYEYPATAEQFAALKSAPSIGHAVAALAKGDLQDGLIKSDDSAKRLETFEPDECCPIGEAISKGIVGDTWVCPKCGETWRARQVESVRHWSPVPMLTVI